MEEAGVVGHPKAYEEVPKPFEDQIWADTGRGTQVIFRGSLLSHGRCKKWDVLMNVSIEHPQDVVSFECVRMRAS